jgi:hypothetical protein
MRSRWGRPLADKNGEGRQIAERHPEWQYTLDAPALVALAVLAPALRPPGSTQTASSTGRGTEAAIRSTRRSFAFIHPCKVAPDIRCHKSTRLRNNASDHRRPHRSWIEGYAVNYTIRRSSAPRSDRLLTAQRILIVVSQANPWQIGCLSRSWDSCPFTSRDRQGVGHSATAMVASNNAGNITSAPA